MSKELEKRFSVYLRKTLKGYSNRKRLIYLKKINKETDLTDANILKASFNNYLTESNKLSDEIDVNYKHPENAFSSQQYYKAMKRVPNKQKEALYLLVVNNLTPEEVAKVLMVNPSNVKRLKEKAIENFKKNLEELNEE